MQKYCKGVTLIELMIALVIVAIVTFIGAPSFNSTIRSTRLTTSTNELVTALSLARSEAIKRNRFVVVRKTGTNWENGWQIFVDTDGSDTLTGAGDAAACTAGNDCLLQVQGTLPNNYTLRFNGGLGNDDYISFSPNGSASENGTFYLCDNSDGNNTPEANTAKLVILNTIGRARAGSDDNNNGIPEITSNTDITTCTP